MRRRGVVLVAVLVVTALVALVAGTLVFRMRAEVAASTSQARGEQAAEAAMSGLEFAMAVLRDYASDMDIWHDNPEIFLNQLVADDGANAWYFTIYGDAADAVDQTTLRYGVTSESGKLDLRTATEEQLLALPNMTDELVDCLLDYTDEDAEARPQGAEQEDYDALPYPYLIPNQPLSTIEELLLVKGFDGAIVYGDDANFNGRLDPNEDDGEESFPPDNGDGRLDRGLRALTTVSTVERNVDSEGRRRIDLNRGPPPEELGLSAETRQFIDVYLKEGNQFKDPSQVVEMQYELKQDHKEYPDIHKGDVIESRVEPDDLPVIMDRLTVGGSRRLTGRVNVNTAPLEVLSALPGMDANVAQQIIDVRRDLDAETKATVAWLYTQNVLDADAFKEVAPRLTARSYQFSVRCVGFGVPCGRYRVVEAIVDLAGRTPRIAYLRDISRLGLPFALDPELIQRSR